MHASGIANQGAALLFGAVGGGLVSGAIVAWTWWLDRRSGLLREFLREGLALHALKEAWILDGTGSHPLKLADQANLPRRADSGGPWLRQVEIRSVLDQPLWNPPNAQDAPNAPAAFYDFIDGRRVWIVRNEVLPLSSYGGPDIDPKQPTYPALLSSQAIHELCGWIERVASARSFLNPHACRALWHLLACMSGDDRIAIFGHSLTKEGADFLRWYREEYPTPGGKKH